MKVVSLDSFESNYVLKFEKDKVRFDATCEFY